LIVVEGGDSGRMSETGETSQANAVAAVLAYRSPRGGQQDAGHEGIAT